MESCFLLELGDQAPTGAVLLSSWVFPTVPEAPTLRHLEVVGRTRLPSPGWLGNHRSRPCQPVCLVKPGLRLLSVRPALPGNPRPALRPPWLGRAWGSGGDRGAGLRRPGPVWTLAGGCADTACGFPGALRPVGRRGCGEPGCPWIRGLAEGRLSHGLGDMPAAFP